MNNVKENSPIKNHAPLISVHAPSLVSNQSMSCVELELAIGAQNLRAQGFTASLEQAVHATGFKLLFDLPIPDNKHFQRLAAIGFLESGEALFIFIALDKTGERAIVHPDLSSIPHIEKFAEAFLGLLLN